MLKEHKYDIQNKGMILRQDGVSVIQIFLWSTAETCGKLLWLVVPKNECVHWKPGDEGKFPCHYKNMEPHVQSKVRMSQNLIKCEDKKQAIQKLT